MPLPAARPSDGQPLREAPPAAGGPEAPPGAGPLRTGPGAAAPPLRRQVFEHVRAQGRAARADLARALGVSAATVTAVTADLIAAGLLREAGSAAPDGRGRPPVALEVVPGLRPVIGVVLGAERHVAVRLDLSGRRLTESERPADARESPANAVAALVADLDRGAMRAEAVGVGMPVQAAPPGDLAAACAARLGRPVRVAGAAAALARAELWFGAGRAEPDFAVVALADGVGLGLVRDGSPRAAPALGHLRLGLDGPLCRCGRRGCLDAYLSDAALAREAALVLPPGADDAPSSAARLAALRAAAAADDPAAREVLAHAGRHLALGLEAVVRLLDPPLLILAGEGAGHDLLLGASLRGALDRLARADGAPLRVEVHPWGDLVAAQGAATLALDLATAAALGP